MIWILESNVFPRTHFELRAAIVSQGHQINICESQGELHLLELNPFSGADLYACNSADVVAAIGVTVRDVRHAV